eukprot:TRINITY_DN1641_c0_g1_i4.p1 TRINITY_DN1641_c0_g1~~TRINITY_DN1641_c0_g1_i4.p1  ORF type:complete len:371 (-),score=148.60 TRINITY_DN1641_c0_g1_i4:139-1122(-)
MITQKVHTKFVPLAKSLEVELLSYFFFLGDFELSKRRFQSKEDNFISIEKEDNGTPELKTHEETATVLVSADTTENVEEFEEFYYYDNDMYDIEDEEEDSEFDYFVEKEEGWLFEEGERVWNKKRNEKVQRNKANNKKERNQGNHISALQERKQLTKKSIEAEQFALQKANATRGVKYATRCCHSGNNNNNNNNDADFQRALQLSLAEQRRNPSLTTEIGLTPQQIAQLQTRELTPEDYELLLTLDKSVKPKTVEEKKVKGFPVVVVTMENVKQFEGNCSVCLMEFGVGDKVKTLPCKHYFHEGCIDTWLTTSSVNCPVDGLSVAGK